MLGIFSTLDRLFCSLLLASEGLHGLTFHFQLLCVVPSQTVVEGDRGVVNWVQIGNCWKPFGYFTVELLDEVEQGVMREKASSVRYGGIISLMMILLKCTHQGRKTYL